MKTITVIITIALSSCSVSIDPITEKPSFSVDQVTLQQLIEKLNKNINDK